MRILLNCLIYFKKYFLPSFSKDENRTKVFFHHILLLLIFQFLRMHLFLIDFLFAVHIGATLQYDMPIKARACLSSDPKQGSHSRRVYQRVYDKESLF